MHHKRGKPKSSRRGCLLCKPHKHQRAKGKLDNQPHQEKLARVREREQRADVDL